MGGGGGGGGGWATTPVEVYTKVRKSFPSTSFGLKRGYDHVR